MVHSSIPADTDPESFALLVERWRSISIAERVDLINQLCADVELLARSDIAARHPDFTERQVCQELVRRRYGDELADAAYLDLCAR